MNIMINNPVRQAKTLRETSLGYTCANLSSTDYKEFNHILNAIIILIIIIIINYYTPVDSEYVIVHLFYFPAKYFWIRHCYIT